MTELNDKLSEVINGELMRTPFGETVLETAARVVAAVVRSLSEGEGWLIRPGGAWPIQELRDSWADDGNRRWELDTVDYETEAD